MQKSRFHYDEIFAVRTLKTGPIKATEIFGPNMAVRKNIFDSGIVFNEEIGPNGLNKNYPMGSETEFCRSAESHGYKAYFCENPKVRHIVRPHQIEKDFWRKRAYRHGLGFGMQEKLKKTEKLSRFDTASILSRGVIKQGLCYFKYLTEYKEPNRQKALWQYYWEKGYLVGRLGI